MEPDGEPVGVGVEAVLGSPKQTLGHERAQQPLPRAFLDQGVLSAIGNGCQPQARAISKPACLPFQRLVQEPGAPSRG